MKIKRIFAQDMRQAIKKVRDEQGPDAVILSSRKVEGGVEVISAVDYDERVIRAAAEDGSQRSFSDTFAQLRDAKPAAPKAAAAPKDRPRQKLDVTVDDDDDIDLSISFREPEPPKPAAKPAPAPVPKVEWTQEPAISEMRQELKTLRSLFESQLTLLEWGQMERSAPVRANILKQLNELGLGPDVCRKLADKVAQETDPDRAWQKALKLIERHLPVTNDDILERGGVIAVIGPTGVGKTTTVAKLAARFALRHGRGSVALVSTDNFRIGAQDQLRNFARILGVPVHTAGNRQELEAVLADLTDKRLVLIDTAGMSQRDMRLAEQFGALADKRLKIRSYLVMSANTQLSTLSEVVRQFKSVGPVGCIMTKLDEATSLGAVLTAVLRHQLPMAYLGIGQRVPEDLQPARSDKLIENACILAQQYRQETDDESLALTFGGVASAK